MASEVTRSPRHIQPAPVNGEYHVTRMRKVAAHLPAVVDARDREGFAILVRKAQRTEDLYALVAILAEAADLGRLAAITGCRVPGRRGEAGSMPAAGERAA